MRHSNRVCGNWSEGRNVQIDVGWGEDDADLEQKNAAQLIALAPDIIFASGTLSVAALRRLNRTVPIVFADVTDPDSRLDGVAPAWSVTMCRSQSTPNITPSSRMR